MFGIRCPEVDTSLQPKGVVFDKEYSELWAIYNNQTRLLVDM